MAGLSRNTIMKRTMPIFPMPDTSLGFWSGMGQGLSGSFYLPGFSGGTAGRSIKIKYANTSTNVYQHSPTSTEVTDGVWNGGMTIDEASGSADTDKWVGFYMDESENKLYCLTMDTGTSPHTLYTSSVNEAGTVTQIGNAQLGNASFNGLDYIASYGNGCYRSGGDGSGTINLTNVNTAGGNAAAGVPYRGITVSVSVSDGSLSYANFLGSTYSNEAIPYGYGLIGPTANSMVLIVYAPYSATDATAGAYMQIVNTANGKHSLYATSGAGKDWPWGTSTTMVQRWRGRYFFVNYANPRGRGASPYLEADVHAWLDEMGVFYGLL